MAEPILVNHVDVFDGVSQFSARPAVVELYEDRFVLVKVDPATGAKTETIFDTPLAGLSVRGSSAMLVFAVDGVRKRVDFSFGTRAAVALGVGGLAVGGALAAKSGVGAWVDALKAKGVPIRFRSYGKTIGLGVGIALGIVVILVAVVVVVALANPS